MRLVSYIIDGESSFGVWTQDGVIDLKPRLGCQTLRDALSRLDEVQSHLGEGPDHAIDDLDLLPPIPASNKILCAGLNYFSHLEETGLERPKRPIIFTRYPDSQVGHLAPLIRPKASHAFDYEGELAVVIGKRCRHVAREDAAEVIAGYSCYNDGSIRDWQVHASQFTPGKNFPASGAFGPALVTPDEVGDLADLSLATRLNGVELQRASLTDLIFDVPDLIAYCSTFTELAPGDVIATGTTGGVGAMRKPPIWMKPGDVVEVEIDRLGTLRNGVIDEA